MWYALVTSDLFIIIYLFINNLEEKRSLQSLTTKGSKLGVKFFT